MPNPRKHPKNSAAPWQGGDGAVNRFDCDKSITTSGTTPRLVNGPVAAEILCISTRSLANFVASGQLPCVRIGRAVRFEVADIAAFVAARKSGGGAA